MSFVDAVIEFFTGDRVSRKDLMEEVAALRSDNESLSFTVQQLAADKQSILPMVTNARDHLTKIFGPLSEQQVTSAGVHYKAESGVALIELKPAEGRGKLIVHDTNEVEDRRISSLTISLADAQITFGDLRQLRRWLSDAWFARSEHFVEITRGMSLGTPVAVEAE